MDAAPFRLRHGGGCLVAGRIRRRRHELHDPQHPVIPLEIATALKRNIRVIPVLVQNAAMSNAEDLPADLALLTRRNAFELSDTRWKHDSSRLIELLEGILRPPREATVALEEILAPKAEAKVQTLPPTAPTPIPMTFTWFLRALGLGIAALSCVAIALVAFRLLRDAL
jgi:hypothetical protein